MTKLFKVIYFSLGVVLYWKYETDFFVCNCSENILIK